MFMKPMKSEGQSEGSRKKFQGAPADTSVCGLMKSAGKLVTTNVTFYVNRVGEIFRRGILATVSRLYLSTFLRHSNLKE